MYFNTYGKYLSIMHICVYIDMHILLLSRFSCVRLCDPTDGSPPGSAIPGILQARTLSGLPFPSPMHESGKWKWSRSVVSDSSRPHGLQPTRLLRPWDFPGKSTWVGPQCLLRSHPIGGLKSLLIFVANTKPFSELSIYLLKPSLLHTFSYCSFNCPLEEQMV